MPSSSTCATRGRRSLIELTFSRQRPRALLSISRRNSSGCFPRILRESLNDIWPTAVIDGCGRQVDQQVGFLLPGSGWFPGCNLLLHMRQKVGVARGTHEGRPTILSSLL